MLFATIIAQDFSEVTADASLLLWQMPYDKGGLVVGCDPGLTHSSEGYLPTSQFSEAKRFESCCIAVRKCFLIGVFSWLCCSKVEMIQGLAHEPIERK